MQIVITNRMRKSLADGLKYLPSEIDTMELQIAAFVMEEKLARPSKGMPDSWRRSGYEESKIQISSKSFLPSDQTFPMKRGCVHLGASNNDRFRHVSHNTSNVAYEEHHYNTQHQRRIPDLDIRDAISLTATLLMWNKIDVCYVQVILQSSDLMILYSYLWST